MDAHEIIDRSMARGDAEKIARRTGRKADYYNSFRREPRSPSNPEGTGNYSPPHHYLQWFALFWSVNREGAALMHSLVSREIEELMVEESSDARASASARSFEVLNQAAEVARRLSLKDVKALSTNELRVLDGMYSALRSAVDVAASPVRAELRERECTRDEVLV